MTSSLILHLLSCMKNVLIMWLLEVTYRFQVGQQQMHGSIFVIISTFFTYGYKRLIQTMVGVVMCNNKVWKSDTIKKVVFEKHKFERPRKICRLE